MLGRKREIMWFKRKFSGEVIVVRWKSEHAINKAEWEAGMLHKEN